MHSFKKIFGFSIVLVAVLAMISYHLAGERFRTHTIEALKRITGGDVVLDHAEITVLRQIRIKGLSIYLPRSDHNERNLILQADDVILLHNPWSFLKQKLQVTQITANGAHLNVWYDHEFSRICQSTGR